MWKKNMVMRILREPSTVHNMIDQKKLKNMEYFNYWCSMITSDTKCVHGIKFSTVMATAAFDKKKAVFTSKFELNLKKKLVNWHI
jgi:hypothetical protein